jgi:ElaB/YqjD/DUF883 family membrane-anchored ribosome-binding protein
MKPDAPQVVAARIEAERTRARLMDTAHRLQARISPSALASNAWQGAKEKGADMAENAVDAVRKRPIAATGVIAAITLFLAREPLIDLAEKLSDSVKGEKDKPKKKSTEKVA